MPICPGIAGPYRFFFFGGDCEEKPQVHIRREGWECKVWLQPVALPHRGRFPAHEIAAIERIVFQFLPQILEAWDEHCGS